MIFHDFLDLSVAVPTNSLGAPCMALLKARSQYASDVSNEARIDVFGLVA